MLRNGLKHLIKELVILKTDTEYEQQLCELTYEINKYKKIAEKTEIISYFDEKWFEDKYLIYLPV